MKRLIFMLALLPMKVLISLLLPTLLAAQINMSGGRTTIAGSGGLSVAGSGGLFIADNNGGTIKYDKNGNANVMVWIPKFNWDQTNEFSSTTVHPAFVVNGVTVSGFWVSKYENRLIDGSGNEYAAGNVTGTSHAYIANSKANVSARYNIDFDGARRACTNMNNGTNITGWHLMSNAEWAAIALWSKNNSTQPLGNNNYGRDYGDALVRGYIVAGDTYGTGNSRWLTGSGGAKTGHDWTINGVMDLNGNLWEWVDGLYISNGLIYVAGNANTSPTWAGNSFTAAEANWYNTGMYVNWDGAASSFTLSASGRGTQMSGNKSQYFGTTIGGDSLLKAIAMAPTASSSSAYGQDYYYANNNGTFFPLRGGLWVYANIAGVFFMYLDYARSLVYSRVGFRSALVEE